MLGPTARTTTVIIIILDLVLLDLSAGCFTGNFKNLTVTSVAMAINTVLIKNRYRAPNKKWKFRVASPKPAVHNGGIRAVAMATPGIMFWRGFPSGPDSMEKQEKTAWK